MVRAGQLVLLEGVQLHGKTLGVIGLGGIGIEVTRIARGIGMNVIGWNRTPRPTAGVPLVGLKALLAQADVISLNLGVNHETRGMIDAARIARMKRGVMLINTARGALVEEAALIAASHSGQIGQAGLDVFHNEPLAPDHPLARMEQRHALLARGLPHARSFDDADAARDRRCAHDRLRNRCLKEA